MGCGKILGSANGYNMTCGNLWLGRIVHCEKCERKILEKEKLELELENARLLNKKLKSESEAKNDL